MAGSKNQEPKPKNKVDHLFDMITAQEAEVRDAKIALYDLRTEFAKLTCPFKVGDVLTHPRGIGAQGVEIIAIQPPSFQTKACGWEIKCFAFSKAGVITKRVVSYNAMEEKFLTLKVKK